MINCTKGNGLPRKLAKGWATDRFDLFCVSQRGLDTTEKDHFGKEPANSFTSDQHADNDLIRLRFAPAVTANP